MKIEMKLEFGRGTCGLELVPRSRRRNWFFECSIQASMIPPLGSGLFRGCPCRPTAAFKDVVVGSGSANYRRTEFIRKCSRSATPLPQSAFS